MISGCDQKQWDNNKRVVDQSVVSPSPQGQIAFSIPDSVNYDLKFFKNLGDSILRAYSYQQHQIIDFDLKNHQFLKVYQLDFEGPESVLMPDGIYFHTTDSTFIHTNDTDYVGLLDEEFKPRNKFFFEIEEDSFMVDGKYIQASPITYAVHDLAYFPFLYHDHVFYFQVVSSSNNWLQYRIPYLVGLQESNNKYFKLRPADYLKYEVPNNPLDAFCIGHLGQIIYSFTNHSQLIDYSSELMHSIGSRYSSTGNITFHEANSQTRDYERDFQSFQWDEAYLNILYDPYQELYYRVFKHAGKDDHEHRHQADWSLIITDTDFNILKEVSFKGMEYDFHSLIPSKYGLLISKHNTQNLKIDENNLVFDIFKF